MSATKRLVHGAADQGSESPARLSSLAISASAEDLAFLESRFREANWRLYVAGTYRQALAELSKIRVPVILCECQLRDGNWKDILSQLALMLERPRLIVFSRHADERLWTEVLNLGAFDLLATPFREDEVVFAIGSAWLDWKDEQEHHRQFSHTVGSHNRW
jgi:DNA-binding response OmpR family regulator